MTAAQFEIIALAFNTKNDEMTVRVKAAFDRYIDVSQYTDLQVAQLIKSLQIDIAVDLKGHTQDARLGIFAYKAAPIQVNYLGQASTIGASYIDYILADRHIAPPQYHADFSEKVVSLPHTYYVNDSKRPISSQVFSRGELGLPETGFVFCCFNNSYKISPTMFDVWMRLLQQIPHSVLWLLEGNAIARQNLCNEAKKCGVAPNRLVFAPKVASSVHLARHQHADLFLDTLPINAHTTACDALWARVPIVTCMGQTFASRVAASLLTAVGLPELITQNLTDYEALALKLATSPLLLAQIKQKLQHREQSPLFDIKAQRIAFESAYKMMYQRYQQGLAPQGFNVEVEHG
jgi:protein O-GlcNAc transferase